MSKQSLQIKSGFYRLQFLFIVLGMLQLLKTDSYYVPYILTFVGALFATYINAERNYSFKENVWVIVFSTFFSLVITLANYKTWSDFDINIDERAFRLIYTGICFIITAVGSSCAFYNILLWIANNIDTIIWKKSDYKIKPIHIFVISFASICIINMTILFSCRYPGVLSPDSISQIEQLLQNSYSNHHPFYHTILIKAFVMIGMKMGGY